MRSSVSSGMVAVALALSAAGALAEETRSVAAGPQYAAGGFHRFWFGNGYRDLWTTPVEVPVLDLQKTGGGLTPVRVVGQAQGLGLAFRGADGKAYTFRSLHKHPERMLPEEWRDRFPAKIAQDQSSHTHPAAGQIFASLAQATGVNFTNPRLVVVPDDPALGEFRKTFAGEFGTIDEYPLAGRRGTARLHGRDRDHLHHRPVASVAHRSREPHRQPGLPPGPRPRPLARQLRRPPRPVAVDAHPRPGALAAPDRGPGHGPRPPRRDAEPGHARVHPEAAQVHRGVPGEARGAAAEQLRGRPLAAVGPRRGGLAGGREGAAGPAHRRRDRPRAAADAAPVVRDRRRRQAGRSEDTPGRPRGLHPARLPLLREASGRARDRQGRGRHARARRRRLDGDHDRARPRASAAPWYRRRFLPGETDEVRVHLHGGNDRVARTGPAGGPVHVRVVAGGGQDVVDDSKSGGTDVWRDAGTVEVERGQRHPGAPERLDEPRPGEGRTVARAPQLRAPDHDGRRSSPTTPTSGSSSATVSRARRGASGPSRPRACRRCGVPSRRGRGPARSSTKGRSGAWVPAWLSGSRPSPRTSSSSTSSATATTSRTTRRSRPTVPRRRCCSPARPPASSSADGSRPSSAPRCATRRPRPAPTPSSAARAHTASATSGRRRSAAASTSTPVSAPTPHRASTSPRASPTRRPRSRSAASTSRLPASTPRRRGT